MNWTNLSARFRAPRLTPGRIALAFAVAVGTDLVQALTGPAGWLFVDEILDVLAMLVTSLALGFHPLLLPTFIIELVPVADWLPTWTGCTAAVVLLRRRSQAPAPPTVITTPEVLPPAQEIPGVVPPKLPEIPRQN